LDPVMPESDDSVLALAAAVLDGTPVDWDAALRSASEATRPVIERLRLVAAINPSPHDGAATTPLPPLRVDAYWGPLRLVARIGAGSSGEVWRAWDSRLEREVALKLLPASVGDPADGGRTVIDEGRLLARVRHPHVVTIHGAERLDGRIGLWMELVEGDDLESLVRTNGPFAPADVVRIGLDVCHALHAIHEAGVLHRDVKAQNVRRTPDGRIVVMDFGSGRELRTPAEPVSDLSGTPLYLAPEIFAGAPATRQSDLYSVGVLLFHLLTGRFPVTGGSVREIAEAHRERRRVFVRDVRPRVPRAVARVVDRSLSGDPTARFASADAFARALRRADPQRRRMALAAITASTLAVVGLLTAARIWSPGTRVGPAISGGGMVQRQLHPPFSPATLGSPSPDGRWLSYVDRQSRQLAVVDLAANTVKLLSPPVNTATSEYATSSTFSGDSRSLAFGWFSQGCSCVQLRTTALAGGEPKTLWTYSGIDEVLVTGWSRDGRYIATWVDDKPGQPGYSLEVFDTQTQQHRPLGAATVGLTGFSPDSRFLAFTRESDGGAQDIYAADLAGDRIERLVGGPGNKSAPQWSADGEHVLFVSRGGGTASVWAQPMTNGRAAGEAVLISKNIGSVSPLGLTDAGSYYYMIEGQASDVLVARVDTREGRVIDPPRRLASSAGSSESPDWSPDGRFVAWRTVPPPFTLLVRDVVTGEERTLTSVTNVGPNPRWSPDGGSLLVRATIDRQLGLFTVDVATGAVRGPFVTERVPIDFAWRPDGRGALVLDYQQGISSVDFSTRKATRVFSPPPRWSHGRGLAISPDGSSLANAVRVRS
jgi:serine/threonine-protein kinase